MGLTLTVEEAKSRTAYDLIQEATRTQQPLIVMLENGQGVIIQHDEQHNNTANEHNVLEPLP